MHPSPKGTLCCLSTLDPYHTHTDGKSMLCMFVLPLSHSNESLRAFRKKRIKAWNKCESLASLFPGMLSLPWPRGPRSEMDPAFSLLDAHLRQSHSHSIDPFDLLVGVNDLAQRLVAASPRQSIASATHASAPNHIARHTHKHDWLSFLGHLFLSLKSS